MFASASRTGSERFCGASAILVHQFSAESVNESAFLVFDLIRRSAGIERDGNARGFIHPEFDQGEGAAGRAEGMIANPRFDAGGFRAPADDPVGRPAGRGGWWSVGRSCGGRCGRDSRRRHR
jgi:hypothetical protein